MNGPIRRLIRTVMALFVVLVLAATYVQAVAAEGYRSDPRNQRTAIARVGKERGLIATADGTVLARSVAESEGSQLFVRQYPEGPAFSHVVGYASRLFGDEGLERTYADELRSRRDVTISDVIAALVGGDLRPRSVMLTIDPDVQRTAFDALEGQTGAVVAIDPESGGVIALVSSPSFVAENLLDADAAEAYAKLVESKKEPLANRATRRNYPPASTFKTLILAAAIEEGKVTPASEYQDFATYRLPGSSAVMRNFDGERCGTDDQVSVESAYINSCNTVFAQVGIDTGAEAIGEMAAALGFGADFEFALPVGDSTFPTDELARDPAALAQSSIGERDVRVTPLQMAMLAATIANDGIVMRPYLVDQLFDADGKTVRAFEPNLLGEAMSPATASVIAEMMERVVTEGTGYRAGIPGVRVAGKTGTSEQGDPGSHVWFIGFAPVERPTIAVAVVVENGGAVGEGATGARVAAPIAAQVIAEWLENRS